MKLLSLIKASMTDGMNLFKISTKKDTKFMRVGLPIILALLLMFSMSTYSEELVKQLAPLNMEYVVLTVFIVLTSLVTFIEGMYKSSSLLFNSKDDNLLLSLPIKRSTVLFIRVLKFYVFELMFNSIFLLPSMIVYAIYAHPSLMFYLVSFIAILLFPIIPILLSCIVGSLISFISSKFRGKNIIEALLIMCFGVAIIYFSYGSKGLFTSIAKNATSINDLITRLYYPAGAYISLVNNFKVLKLLEFISINLLIFIIFTYALGLFYFKINSMAKSIKVKKSNKKYLVKSSCPIKALIKKEFNRFINSPVFVTNAAFGLLLFLIGCGAFIFKFDVIMISIAKKSPVFAFYILKHGMPILLFAFICFSSFMTSITSSMISLEGSSFNILKSLPVKPYTIVKSKVLTACLVMIPVLLVGSILVFIKFEFDLISILLILVAIAILPLISSTIGIIVNLKYPKMDAKSDTEVVKQSMSSMISVFIGMGLSGLTIFALYKALKAGIASNIILILFILVFIAIYYALKIYLKMTCDKDFNNIAV